MDLSAGRLFAFAAVTQLEEAPMKRDVPPQMKAMLKEYIRPLDHRHREAERFFHSWLLLARSTVMCVVASSFKSRVLSFPRANWEWGLKIAQLVVDDITRQPRA
jgi:hypothetical protein